MTETLVNFFKHAAGDVPDKSLCIVALPASDSPTLPIGSEEKHATLLMLGEDVDPTSAALVQASIDGAIRYGDLSPFTERVSGVTSLGDQGARVWMIDSDNGLKMIRDRLVRIPAIRALYDMEKQYPNYTPHVTIGYPNAGEDYLSGIFESLAANIDRIRFDRIGLWYGDNHDTTWRLSPSGPMDSVEASVDHDDLIGLVLAHASGQPKTVQDIYDSMTDAQREVSDLIVGAAIEDLELPEDEEFAKTYNSMSDLQKDFIEFVVGATMDDDFFDEPDDGEVEHGTLLEEFLAHYGIKGMKWGVRKGEISGKTKSGDFEIRMTKEHSKALRAAVEAGNGNLTQAHLAALKSRGHRVTNALLGDKTYWKRAAVILGLTAAVVGGALAAPAVLPASAVAAVGLNGSATTSALIGLKAASTANSVTNFMRAIRGNARINSSLDKLGELGAQRQQSGNARVQRILRTNGSIRGKVLHDDMSIEEFENFLAHFGVKGMKWGVRRSDAELAKAAKNMAKNADRFNDIDEIRVGDNRYKKTDSADVSEDALRFIEQSQKPPVALTDQEIRQVLDRARITKQYDELFNPQEQPNSELKQKVEKLRLEKEFSQLNAEMNPSLASRVSKLIQGATKSFEAYQKLDEVSDNKLTNEIRKAFKLPPIKEPRSKKLSREIKAMEQEKKHAKLLRDLRDMGIDISANVAASEAASKIAG